MKKLRTKASVTRPSALLASYEITGNAVPFGFLPSPDCKLLAYLFGDSLASEGDLWVISLRTGMRRCLVWDDHLYWSPSWGRASGELAVCSSRSGSGEVWVLRLGDTRPRLLTFHGKNISHVQWSPDGSKIAFFSSKTGAYELWVMNSDGSDQRQLTANRLWVDPFQTLGGRVPLALTWSPDSKAIAFSAIEPQRIVPDADLFLRAHPPWLLRLQTIALEGTQPVVKLLFSAVLEHRDSGFIRDLSWSPAGDRLACKLTVNGASSLLLLGTDGIVERRFDCLHSLSARPWSRGGRQIVYAPTAERFECYDIERGVTTAIDFENGGDSVCGEATFLPGTTTLVALLGNRLNMFTLSQPMPRHVELRQTTAISTWKSPELSRRSELEKRAKVIKGELESLVVSGDPERLDFAIAALEDAAFHWLASRAIAAMGASFAMPALMRALASSDPIVRSGAVQAAELLVDAHGLKPERELIALIIGILRGTAGELPHARVLAASLLGKANAGQAIHDLLHTALDEDEAVRVASIIALGRIGEPNSIAGILKAPPAGRRAYVEFEDGVVDLDFGRREIWDLGGSEGTGTAMAYGDPVELAKVKALAMIDSFESLLTLEKLTAHSDPAIRYWAMRLLVGLRGVEMQRVYEAALLDTHPAVRALAISALQQAGVMPSGLGEPFRVEMTPEVHEYGGADEIRWEVSISGSLINTHSAELHNVTASACCGDRPEVEELGTMSPGEKREFLFFFVLSAWETVPEAINIVVESSEGIRQIFPLTLGHNGR